MKQFRDFTNIKTWDDVLVAAADLRQYRDDFSWELGDLCLYACAPNPGGGRPVSGAEDKTLAHLAYAIGEQRPVLSSLMWNSAFWPLPERVKMPPNVSWRQCSEARRRSGWRPGAEVTPLQRNFAWECVMHYADDLPEANGRTPPALADLLDKVYSRLVYLAERAEGQPGARSAIERAAEYVRLAVERLGEPGTALDSGQPPE